MLLQKRTLAFPHSEVIASLLKLTHGKYFNLGLVSQLLVGTKGNQSNHVIEPQGSTKIRAKSISQRFNLTEASPTEKAD